MTVHQTKMAKGQILTLFLCFLFFSIRSVSSQGECGERWFLIRTSIGSFYLDGASQRVTIEHHRGDRYQRWRFDCGDLPGHYYIINNATGYVLDVINDGDYDVLYQNERSTSLTQQWFLEANERIANKGIQAQGTTDRYFIDVYWANYTVGNFLILFYDHSVENEHYIIEEVC